MSENGASPMIEAKGLVKRYESGRVAALDGLDLRVHVGEFVAICGPSGCGKSTLLNMLSGIDRLDHGDLQVGGHRLANLTDRELGRFRGQTVGLVFQLHNLLPNLTAIENVQVPMLTTTRSAGARVERAHELLASVGLSGRENALPPTLSGGERQRVAVARALANEPKIILADEPTGALDSKTGEMLCELLASVRAEQNATLVVVTHDEHVAAKAQRVVNMLDGKVVGTADDKDPKE